MANLKVALHAAGADLRDVVKTTVYVATQTIS
jgi:enamine deaminase RidA (YjgF/YER057c/UK114 family)